MCYVGHITDACYQFLSFCMLKRISEHCNNSWIFSILKISVLLYRKVPESKAEIASRIACIYSVSIKSHCSQISNLNHPYCVCLCVRNSWRNHPISFKYIVRLLFFVSFRFASFHFVFVLLWRDCAHYRDDLSEKGHIKYISVPYLVYHCMVVRQREREEETEISVKQIIKIMKTWRKR